MESTARSATNSRWSGAKRDADRANRRSSAIRKSKFARKWPPLLSRKSPALRIGPSDRLDTGIRPGGIEMSITVIDTNNRRREPSPAGTVRQIVTSDDKAKDLRAAIHDISPGKSQEFNSESRSHLLYVLEGDG